MSNRSSSLKDYSKGKVQSRAMCRISKGEKKERMNGEEGTRKALPMVESADSAHKGKDSGRSLRNCIKFKN